MRLLKSRIAIKGGKGGEGDGGGGRGLLIRIFVRGLPSGSSYSDLTSDQNI